MDVRFDSDIPAFRRHATNIYKVFGIKNDCINYENSLLNFN
jgi:hypothetical protein